MPVITPAYPCMCATYNVTKSALAIIKDELARAAQIAESIMHGQRQWADLFTKHSFFTNDFKYYLAVISTSMDKEEHKVWSGFIESKVRMLVQSIERHASIGLARPFNKGFERVHLCKTPEEIELVKDGSLDFVVKKTEETAVNAKSEMAGTELKAEAAPNVKSEKLDIKLKPEINPQVAPSDIKEQGEGQPVKEENQDKKAKLDEEDDDAVEVYTQTHYIGLELAQGKCNSAVILWVFSLILGSSRCQEPRLVISGRRLPGNVLQLGQVQEKPGWNQLPDH